MHPCLSIDEIFQEVLGHVGGHRKTLRSLSLVCRTFVEPANEQLWSDLPDIRPLVNCLPSHLISKSETKHGALTIVNAPLRAEWSSFQRHACLVKSLLVDDAPRYLMDGAALAILAAYCPRPSQTSSASSGCPRRF